MNPFDQDIAAHFEELATEAGRDVVYKRGDVDLDITAVRGNTDFEEADDNGILAEMEVPDWILTAADLSIDDELFEPAEGDRIVVEDAAGRTLTYEILPNEGVTAFQYMDPNRAQIRVHTKLISGGDA